MCGEEFAIIQGNIDFHFYKEGSSIRKDYSPRNIFNANDTARRYKAQPSSTLTFKDMNGTVTIYVACNMDFSGKKYLSMLSEN